MCSVFIPGCGYDNSTIILIRDVYCPNTTCWGKLWLTKEPFNLSAEAIINVPTAHLCDRCAMFLLKIKQVTFFWRLARRFTFSKRTPNHLKIILQMSIVLASIVLTERYANLLTVMYQGWDLYMGVECAERGCLFTKWLLRYKSTRRRQKQTKQACSLLEKYEFVTRQIVVH